ncbi:MAG: hypothetical protein JJT76_03070 [Clostridiaceae bacterium]|nr:hypothetical protein [Clostridiaceae bacterium]
MDKKDIVVSWDFNNLTSDDIKEITNYIDLEFPEGIAKYEYLHSIKDDLFEIPEVSDLLLSKLFAGRTSIKWFTFDISDDAIDEMIARFEDTENNCFERLNRNVDIESTLPQKYVCIKLEEGKYLLRVIVSSSYKSINTGTEVNRIRSMKNVITLIDFNNKFIEIRADYNTANIIKTHIYQQMLNRQLSEYEILSRYSNRLENFAYDLNDGRFIRVLSIPNLNIELSSEQERLLLDIIEGLNKYFTNRNLEDINNILDNADLSTNPLSFTQLFLAGLAKIGISTRVDIEEDLSSQVLYGMLQPYMTNENGHISFKINGNTDNKDTILIGINTRSVSFKTQTTEQSIEYIRSKLLGI